MNKRKLSRDEKRRKKERKAAFMTVFINGKQKRVRRPQLIDGLPVDEFIARNADPLWLHQNGMWEFIPMEGDDVVGDMLPGPLRTGPLNSLTSAESEMDENIQSQENTIHDPGCDEVPF